MKFDRAALATMLAVSAAALAGCEQKQCVDAKGKVVSNTYCGGSGGGAGGGVHPGFFFVPIGRMGGGFGGGSASTVSRGGFGGEAGGHGGAAGE